MVPRALTRHNEVVPELPDLDILADAFHATLAGRPVTGSRVPQTLVLRGTSAELDALQDQRLRRVARRGKFLVFTFERDQVTMNPMLTGRLGLATPGVRPLVSTALVLGFGSRPGPPLDAATWTQGQPWRPSDAADVELRYRDPTRMGKIYLLPQGVTRRVAGWEEQGPDVDDPVLDLTEWRRRIGHHSGELKNLLKNQSFVAGIGNGYSDEILWAARLAPFRKRSTLADEEVARLWEAARTVPIWAISELRLRVPPKFEKEVRDFLNVHRKGGRPCPRCGASITEIAPGGFVTSWCRACQA